MNKIERNRAKRMKILLLKYQRVVQHFHISQFAHTKAYQSNRDIYTWMIEFFFSLNIHETASLCLYLFFIWWFAKWVSIEISISSRTFQKELSVLTFFSLQNWCPNKSVIFCFLLYLLSDASHSSVINKFSSNLFERQMSFRKLFGSE